MTPLFKNPSVGNIVTVDLDVWAEYFLRPKEEVPADEKPGITIGYIREQIIILEGIIEREISVHYRRSSKGHIHLRLTLPHEITVFDAFLLRSCLFDDLIRQSLDQRRYAIWNNLHQMNKCFDYKAEAGGKIYSSGPWIPLHTGRDELAGEASEDWQEYMVWRKSNPLKTTKEKGQTELGFA